MNAKIAAPAGTTGIEPILAQLKTELSGSRQRDGERLAAAFFRRIAADDRDQRTPGTWAAIVHGLLQFVTVRMNEHANVRAFNPGQDEHG